MNEDFTRHAPPSGWIEVIVGCMFSGKTEELIKQVRRAHIARRRTQTFKPEIDARYSIENVASHDQNTLTAYPVATVADLEALIDPKTMVVAIDEGQFFGPELVSLSTRLANEGRRVIIAGLDTDWRGEPFGPMPQLMAVAEVVRKQHAICRVCGGFASRTQRLTPARDHILVGSFEVYEARCRQHFDPESTLRPLTPPPESPSFSEL